MVPDDNQHIAFFSEAIIWLFQDTDARFFLLVANAAELILEGGRPVDSLNDKCLLLESLAFHSLSFVLRMQHLCI